MELHADHVVAPGDGREIAAVVGGRDHHVVRSVAEIGVHEIDVAPVLEAVEQRVRPPSLQPIPSHVRHRQVAVETAHATGEQAQALMAAVLFALLEQHLHADADAQERRAPGRGLAQHGHEVALPDLVHGRAEGAVAGQDQRLRLAQLLGISGEQGGRARVPKALGDAAQVAEAVVDDRDHSEPLVLGTPFTRGSLATAMLSARDDALKRVSAMWWAFRPRSASRWMLSRP